MKIKFDNAHGGAIAYMGKPRIEIPARGSVTIDFGEHGGEKVEKIVAYMKQRFPALSITKIEDAAAPKVESVASEKMTLEAFTSAAVVTEKDAGWNEVAVEGAGTYKVRTDSTGEKTVIELAYAKYVAE